MSNGYQIVPWLVVVCAFGLLTYTITYLLQTVRDIVVPARAKGTEKVEPEPKRVGRPPKEAE